jgi:hypothetical protein
MVLASEFISLFYNQHHAKMECLVKVKLDLQEILFSRRAEWRKKIKGRGSAGEACPETGIEK